jgi:hypothetical protein
MQSAPVTSKRVVIAHVLVCLGCCCGNTDKGNPPVPVDWLKAQWKQRKLLRTVHLSISGCLGPCDVKNVVTILTPRETIWLGELLEQADYEELLQWATLCVREERLFPLPARLAHRQFNPLQPKRKDDVRYLATAS